MLAYLDRPGTSNGPDRRHLRPRTPRRLRPSALRNLTNYVARGLLEAGASAPAYTLDCDEPSNLATLVQQTAKQP